MRTSRLMGLRVAGLTMWLDARQSGIQLTVPDCHERFLAPERFPTPPLCDDLVLLLRQGLPADTRCWQPVHYPTQTWELWRDEAGRYVFVTAPQSLPRRHLVVDSAFSRGELIGDFSPGNGHALYPVHDIDVILFVNWLAQSGDLILHAAGLALNGRGVAFAGPGGAGKSTVATALAETAGATVLGEDQVALRYLDGRFWIYGTPWHLDPARCSPRGVPLDRLFFLDRAGRPGVEPCPPLAGVERLLQTAFIPYYRPDAVGRILDRLAHLVTHVPLFTLSYRLGTDVMALLRAA